MSQASRVGDSRFPQFHGGWLMARYKTIEVLCNCGKRAKSLGPPRQGAAMAANPGADR